MNMYILTREAFHASTQILGLFDSMDEAQDAARQASEGEPGEFKEYEGGPFADGWNRPRQIWTRENDLDAWVVWKADILAARTWL